MTVRFYVLPLVRDAVKTNFRGPKYFTWGNTAGLADPWAMMDYGLIDFCVVCSDISPADHTTLSANADVLSLPVNIDNTLTAGAVTTAKNFLEAQNVPAGWINTGDTYRSVLRTTLGMFHFMQRFTQILGQPVDFASVPLSTTFGSLPAGVKSALSQAATELGYDTSGVTGATTLRTILKLMADAWASQPFVFGTLATL